LPWQPSESELLVLSTRNPDGVRPWVSQQGFSCVVAGLDSRDTPLQETEICAFDHLTVVSFKREVSYTTMDHTVYPCPTGLIPDPLVFLKPYRARSIPVTFMAGASNLTRAAIASALRSIPGAHVLLNERVPRPDYLARLQDSKIGVSCYGAGFESYRYWEIPQAGCLLVAQAPPILIPHNFQAGHHALFYVSPLDMLTAIRWALGHAQEAEMRPRT
jgi:hypothetical protein